jgi:hypothetical protein
MVHSLQCTPLPGNYELSVGKKIMSDGKKSRIFKMLKEKIFKELKV